MRFLIDSLFKFRLDENWIFTLTIVKDILDSHLSSFLINPEGFKKFQYREGWAEDWFNPFFDIPKLISLAYLIYDIYIFPDLKGFRI